MAKVIDSMMARYEAARRGLVALLRTRRAGWPWFDHLARAWVRFEDKRGSQLAAALTFYAFLSFFPLLALAYALLGYVVNISETTQEYLIKAMEDYLPGLADKLDVQQIAQARQGAGVIGLIGLALAGLGWVASLRASIRDLWDQDPNGAGNYFLVKGRDLLILLFLGLMLICSVAATTVTTSLTNQFLDLIGMSGSSGGAVLVVLAAPMVALVFNTIIFLVLYTRLSGTNAHWRHVFKGAMLAAVGFEVLKTFAALLLSRTANNPVYASFAVLIGVLIWMNLVSRLTFYAAAWTATRSKVMTADTPTHADPDAA
ncbi:YihY/virulence factor BrkB family protein [Actinocorallia longicatena]|uniref:YihY/virulence factor BrkB family protein n=1 Tax=Actinocorallia longicatena TaxID=111803 RepID=A0ABP6QH94_9ACTN